MKMKKMRFETTAFVHIFCSCDYYGGNVRLEIVVDIGDEEEEEEDGVVIIVETRLETKCWSGERNRKITRYNDDSPF